ncbi:PINc/VapC family ATPase [Haloarchaeobius amylolyticus]|uniref:PINc/VapC family ATPase n=1 Tax=Haloarchaeobius amylolyticus TaxID=1198296 RepID=UPI00226DCE05|nr:PINc/VapC family ATPase [Haloarchaeobius amylolyticus]
MNVVPDTSVVVDGRVSERVENGSFADAAVFVPGIVVDELESQANRGKETGWDGLDELDRLARLADEGRIEFQYVDSPPAESGRGSSYSGTNDAIIRHVAADHDALLFTSDRVQARVAEARGIAVEYVEPYVPSFALPIASFFDDQTMSVHLKAGVRPMAKRGHVGEMRYEAIDEDTLAADEVRQYAHDILDSARRSDEAFVELDERGMQIVQFGAYRIAIARPPFSDDWEITAVRALVQTDLDEYDHAAELESRLLEGKRGVLVAGAPGAGKSTLAQAIARFLGDNGNVVKTMEKPRDLQVGPEITQYTALGGRMDRTADSLLLVRPDYTIFDEVRKTSDFRVFADMRLAGVGMVGVVHASRAIDALQRLVGRVEFGMIPQIVDTVVYVEDGRIQTVYDIETEVKLPEGMTSMDLTRPVITVRDFETEALAYELYLFSRQVVTVPVAGEPETESESGVSRLARREIEREIRSMARGHVVVDLQSDDRAVVYVDADDIAAVIGPGGDRIDAVEDRLGLDIDVRTHEEWQGPKAALDEDETVSQSAVSPEFTPHHVVLPTPVSTGETADVYVDETYLLTATAGRGGEIRVSRGSDVGERLEDAIDDGRHVSVRWEAE